jgi:carboxymethylenebutenolidase
MKRADAVHAERARALLKTCGVDAKGLTDSEVLTRAHTIVQGAYRYQAESQIVETWDRHLASEFDLHDADATMATMVDDPYLLHVPVMTGAKGREGVRRFYAEHFVEGIPADWSITLISRTVGIEQVVDELVISFTHDVEVDFLLPGVPPTGRHVESPTVAIGAFRDGMVRYEHIYWDQASVLIQLGLLEPRDMPCVGAEQARKLLDDAGPFNALLGAAD